MRGTKQSWHVTASGQASIGGKLSVEGWRDRLLSVVAIFGSVMLIGASGANASETGAACDRDCLQQMAARYVAALVHHDATGLPLASNFRATENGVPLAPGKGSWKTLEAFRSQPQYVADVEAQEIGYLGVAQDAGQPAFFGLRLKISNGQITEAESILSHDGESGPAFEPEGFIYREAPYIREVPLAVRTTRDRLLEIANLYWDVSTSTHRGEKLPYSVDCWHFENGMNTDWERFLQPAEQQKREAPENRAQDFDGRIWTCAREAILTTASWTNAHDRHFLLDLARGLVFNIVYVDVAGRGNLGGPQNGTKAPAPPAPPPDKEPIDGPGGMPLGLSPPGMQAAMSGKPYEMAHFEVMRIVGGRITREQDVMRILPDNTVRPFQH